MDEQPITWPWISEDLCPLEIVEATARDGAKAAAVLRKPPGEGPFPAVVFLHGGLNRWPVEKLKASVMLPGDFPAPEGPTTAT